MRILNVNSIFTRYVMLGADEQEVLATVRYLTELGHEVLTLTMNNSYNTMPDAEKFYASLGMTVELLPYQKQRWHWRRFTDPAFLDGASWECGQPHMVAAMKRVLDEWQPDLVWSRVSFSWALAKLARQRGIPTVIRSVNFEPTHEYLKEGTWLANQIRYYGKLLSEKRCIQNSDLLVAITPDEQRIYQRLTPNARIEMMPLHCLPLLLRPPQPTRDRAPLRVFCMGAGYNVSHNLAALEFLVTEIVPLARQQAPGAFEFHVLGGKIPAAVTRHAAPDLIFDGFVPDLDQHLADMDIALVPSLYGQGMQQKVFEPMCRGFPTLTNGRALAGYAYVDGESVLLAESAEDYVQGLRRLQDPTCRQSFAEAASRQSSELFGVEQLHHSFQRIFKAVGVA